MEENASFNSCNALSFHGLSSIPCSGVTTCQILLPLCFFTSTLFNGCASSKTSSSVCAPSLQGLRSVLLCNKPPPSSSLSRIFSTVATFLPSLSPFLSLFLFASTKRSLRPTKVYTDHSSNLSTSCPQTCPPLSERLSCLFLFIRSSFLYISVVLFLDNPPRHSTSAFKPSFSAFFTSITFPTRFFHFFTQPADHKPWLTANPQTTRAVTCQARKVCRGSKSVRRCVSLLFPDEAGVRECLSQDRRGRARTLASHLPGPDDTPLRHLRSIPHDRKRNCGRWWDFRVFHSWMTTVTPLRHDWEGRWRRTTLRTSFRSIECRGSLRGDNVRVLASPASWGVYASSSPAKCGRRPDVMTGSSQMTSASPRDGVLNQRPSGHWETSQTEGLPNTQAVDESHSLIECW